MNISELERKEKSHFQISYDPFMYAPQTVFNEFNNAISTLNWSRNKSRKKTKQNKTNKKYNKTEKKSQIETGQLSNCQRS